MDPTSQPQPTSQQSSYQRLENYTKQTSHYGKSQSQSFLQFFKYSLQCSNPLSIYIYMQQHNIGIYLDKYWKCRANAHIDLLQFEQAMECLRKILPSKIIITDSHQPDVKQYLRRIKNTIRGVVKKYSVKLKAQQNQKQEEQSSKETGNRKRTAMEQQLIYNTDKDNSINKDNKQDQRVSFQQLQNLITMFNNNYQTEKQQLSWMSKLGDNFQSEIRKSTINKPQINKKVGNVNQIQSKREPTSQQKYKSIKNLLTLKFTLKQQPLLHQILTTLNKNPQYTFTISDLADYQTKHCNLSTPYIPIYIPKSNPHPSQLQLTNCIIASCLFPYDVEPFFYQHSSSSKLSQRVAIQLFYAAAYGHPSSAIKLRLFLTCCTMIRELVSIRCMVLLQVCLASSILISHVRCIIQGLMLKLLKNVQQNNKSKIKIKNNMNKMMTVFVRDITNQQKNKKYAQKYSMKVQKNDQYISDYAEYQQASQWYDNIIEKSEKYGIINQQIKQQIVVSKAKRVAKFT